MSLCLLCRSELDSAPVNREHFIHNILIRESEQLRVPRRFRHVIRQSREGAEVHDWANHKTWATLNVHRDCNSRWSYVGSIWRAIINAGIREPTYEEAAALSKYYSNIWDCDDIMIRILTNSEVQDLYSNKKCHIMYEYRTLRFGRIELRAAGFNSKQEHRRIFDVLSLLDAPEL